jgi:hypothetical protein
MRRCANQWVEALAGHTQRPDARAGRRAQFAEDVCTLARVVRTFGTESGKVAP